MVCQGSTGAAASTTSQGPSDTTAEAETDLSDSYIAGLEAENNVLRAELEALRLEIEAAGESLALEEDEEQEEENGLGGEAYRWDVGTQASLPWRSHGGALMHEPATGQSVWFNETREMSSSLTRSGDAQPSSIGESEDSSVVLLLD